MKSETLEKFLQQHGINENSSPEKVAETKSLYHKNYQKLYKQKRRKTLKYLRLELPQSDFDIIEKMAKRHQMKVATFARQSIFAYLSQRYLIPQTGELHQLKMEIRKIGTNLNQVARKVNQEQYPDYYQTVFNLKENVNELEQLIKSKFENPPNMIFLLEELFQNNPEMKEQVKSLISKLEENDC